MARVAPLWLLEYLESPTALHKRSTPLRKVFVSAERARKAAKGTLSSPDLSSPPLKPPVHPPVPFW